jgi:curved DNA-binding protein CbpA
MARTEAAGRAPRSGTAGDQPDATRSELKARYKQLVKQHHPDLHGGDKRAEERLKLINEAYTYLRDSESFT